MCSLPMLRSTPYRGRAFRRSPIAWQRCLRPIRCSWVSICGDAETLKPVSGPQYKSRWPRCKRDFMRRLNLAAAVALLCGLAQAQTATTVSLSGVSPAAPRFGQTVTLTAQITPAAAPGTVAFMDGGALVGIGTLNSKGIAQSTTLTL